MEKPRIRWVEGMPFVKEGVEMILLRDGEGLTENNLIISSDMAFLMSLMDGTRTLREIQAEYMRVFGEILYMEHIEALVRTLDENFLLLNERTEGRLWEMKMEYANNPARPASLAGMSYPGNRMELLVFLDELFKAPAQGPGPGEGREGAGIGALPGELAGILAPHIDYQRGGRVYRETYGHLQGAGGKGLIVIFGTSHRPTERLWSISLKDFETPIERVRSSGELGELIKGNEVLRGYVDEWPHRQEHSIELQLPLLQFCLPDEFEILPILTGSMEEEIAGEKEIDDGEITDLIENLRTVLLGYGKPVIVIAGADLAHIGAEFGDTYSLNSFVLDESRGKDEILLEHVRNVDARGFFGAIKRERDERRICGLTPIFFQLSLLQGCRCNVVSYDQWTDGQSSVSFAGAVFYNKSSARISKSE
jgi:AmmeMemoRadiSam system protein B